MTGEEERADIRARFGFQQDTAAVRSKHDEVRAQHRALALWVAAALPPSVEREQALIALQSSMQWCLAAVTIRTEPEPLGFGMPDRA